MNSTVHLQIVSILALCPAQLLVADDVNPLQLVGDDAGLCVAATNLEEHLQSFRESAIVERFVESDFYRQWLDGKDYRNVLLAGEQIQSLTGQPVNQLFSELFGKSVVFAVFPGSNKEAVGVLLSQTSGRDKLQSTIDAIAHAQNLSPRKMEHAGAVYFRVAGAENGQLLYANLDGLLAVSDNEDAIRRVLELYRDAPSATANGSLFHSESYGIALSALSRGTAVSIYFNPRAWDAVVEIDREGSIEQKLFSAIWDRCRFFIAGMRFDNSIVVEVIADYDNTDVPDAWDLFVKQVSGNPAFLNLVPSDALLALAGRYDPAGGGRAVNRLSSTTDDRQWQNFREVLRGLLLGQDLFDDVLPSLGTNWGAYVVANPDSDKDRVPFDALVAMELPANAEDGSDTMRAAIENGLNTGISLIATMYNAGRAGNEPAAIVRKESDDATSISWIEDLRIFEPAFGIAADYLVFSTSPRLLREFAAREGNFTEHSAYSRLQREYFSEQNQVAFVDLSALVSFVGANTEFFIGEDESEEAAAKLERLQKVLGLSDSAFVTLKIDPNRIRAVVGTAAERDQGQPDN